MVLPSLTRRGGGQRVQKVLGGGGVQENARGHKWQKGRVHGGHWGLFEGGTKNIRILC